MMRKKYDKKEWYCRMLGHDVPFRYCRTMREGLPCAKIFDCWFEILPIKEFVEENYSEEEQRQIHEPPRSRISAIAEILEKARKNQKKE